MSDNCTARKARRRVSAALERLQGCRASHSASRAPAGVQADRTAADLTVALKAQHGRVLDRGGHSLDVWLRL